MELWVWLVLPVLALAAGFSAARGQTCAILAVRDWVYRRRVRRFAGFAVMAASAGLVSALLTGTVSMSPNKPDPSLLFAALGGAAFGMGAFINGGCVFGTLTKLGEGRLVYLLTVAGIGAGAITAAAAGSHFPVPTMPPVVLATNPVITAIGCALVLLASLTWLRTRLSRRSLAWLVVFGCVAGTLFALRPNWGYEGLVLMIASQAASGEMLSGETLAILLTCATLAGSIASAALAGRLAPRWADARTALGCFVGGWLMSSGAMVAGGGNDWLLLRDLPQLAPTGIVAYATFVAVACWLVKLEKLNM